MNQLVLLGDIGQVEELVERTGHWQEFVVGESVEGLVELPFALGRALACSLGPLADALDLVEEGISQLGTDRIAEQLAEQVDILTQTRVDFGHGLPSVAVCVLQIADSVMQIQGRDERRIRTLPRASLNLSRHHE
ncbi:hypothetical protein D9M73_146830 [compost metagenome]